MHTARAVLNSASALPRLDASALTEVSLGVAPRPIPYIVGMSDTTSFAIVAALLGDPARANMLNALMDGRALTASELAYAAHVSAPTTSGHLSKLTEAGLLALERQGRHRYYRLSSPLVGQMIESIMAVAGAEREPRRTAWRGGEALRHARTCYDHLAGQVAVALADRLAAEDHVRLGADGGEVTERGHEFLAAFGVDLTPRGRRIFCRPCLDWSERRPHLAGLVGASITSRCFDLGWIKRQRDTRAVLITADGKQGLASQFGLALG